MSFKRAIRNSMLFVVSCILILTLSGCSFSGLEAKGQVRLAGASEPESSGVYDAVVVIGKYTVHTGINGEYSIKGIKPGTYTAKVAKAGYENAEVEVVIASDGSITPIVITPKDGKVAVDFDEASMWTSQMAGEVAGASSVHPLHFKASIVVEMTSPSDPEQRVYKSAAEVVVDWPEPLAFNLDCNGLLDLYCDEFMSDYTVKATIAYSGNIGDTQIPLHTYEFNGTVIANDDGFTGSIQIGVEVDK